MLLADRFCDGKIEWWRRVWWLAGG